MAVLGASVSHDCMPTYGVHWPINDGVRDEYQISARPRPCLIAFLTHGKQYHSLPRRQPAISEDYWSGRMASEAKWGTKNMPVQNTNYIPELEMFSHLFPHLFKSFNYDIIVLFRDTYKFTVAGSAIRRAVSWTSFVLMRSEVISMCNCNCHI